MGVVAGSAGGDHRSLTAVGQRQLRNAGPFALGTVDHRSHIVLVLLKGSHILILGRTRKEHIRCLRIFAILGSYREKRLGDAQKCHPVRSRGQLVLELGDRLVSGKLIVGYIQSHTEGIRRVLLIGRICIKRIDTRAEVVGGDGIRGIAAGTDSGAALSTARLPCGGAAGGQRGKHCQAENQSKDSFHVFPSFHPVLYSYSLRQSHIMLTALHMPSLQKAALHHHVCGKPPLG